MTNQTEAILAQLPSPSKLDQLAPFQKDVLLSRAIGTNHPETVRSILAHLDQVPTLLSYRDQICREDLFQLIPDLVQARLSCPIPVDDCGNWYVELDRWITKCVKLAIRSESAGVLHELLQFPFPSGFPNYHPVKVFLAKYASCRTYHGLSGRYPPRIAALFDPREIPVTSVPYFEVGDRIVYRPDSNPRDQPATEFRYSLNGIHLIRAHLDRESRANLERIDRRAKQVIWCAQQEDWPAMYYHLERWLHRIKAAITSYGIVIMCTTQLALDLALDYQDRGEDDHFKTSYAKVISNGRYPIPDLNMIAQLAQDLSPRYRTLDLPWFRAMTDYVHQYCRVTHERLP